MRSRPLGIAGSWMFGRCRRAHELAGALGPDLEGGELKRLCPESVEHISLLRLEWSRRSPAQKLDPPRAQRREASRIRGQSVVLPVGIDSGGYDHRRNELMNTVTARGFEPLRKRRR
jgi:hypothetical protein